MSKIEGLRRNYQRICGLPWDRNVAGPQRVWLAVYAKEDERKLRLRLGLFEEATYQAGRRWHRLDLTDAFVLPLVEDHIRGRLLVFFPGVYEQNNYRLLDARDGWNYHVVPITASEGVIRR